MVFSQITKTCICIAFFLLMTLLVTTSPSKAQSNSDLPTEFLAGLAFYKFARVDPDFKTWVFHSAAYRSSDPTARENLMRSEVPRLQRIYDGYEIEKNPITLRVKARIALPGKAEIDKATAAKKPIAVKIDLIDQKTPYFPVEVGEMWIALIPKDFEQMQTLTFTPEEYDVFKRDITAAHLHKGNEATLVLTLVPIKADTKAPLQVDGFNLWMLMADVVGYELWPKEGKSPAWYMDAIGNDKYIENNEVYNLFGK